MNHGLKNLRSVFHPVCVHSHVYKLLPAVSCKMVVTRSKANAAANLKAQPEYRPPPISSPYNVVFRRSVAKVKTKPKSTDKKSQALPASKTSAPTDLPIHAFATAKDFETFLDESHLTCPGIWLKLARKSSGIPTILTMEAVETALCFGWINGQGKSFDENYYLARYTPRRSKSLWSELNVSLVEKMTDEGRMRPAGLDAVKAAKDDGRWDRAYARPTDMVVPEDLEVALEAEANAAAKAFFEGLGRGKRYMVLHKVYTASPAAREARVRAVVDGLADGRVPGERLGQ